MRKALPILACVAMVTLLIGFTSCKKGYNCECTYVAEATGSSAGQPNKTENTDISANIQTTALGQCSDLESKYWAIDFQGTCTLH